MLSDSTKSDYQLFWTRFFHSRFVVIFTIFFCNMFFFLFSRIFSFLKTRLESTMSNTWPNNWPERIFSLFAWLNNKLWGLSITSKFLNGSFWIFFFLSFPNFLYHCFMFFVPFSGPIPSLWMLAIVSWSLMLLKLKNGESWWDNSLEPKKVCQFHDFFCNT